MIKKNMHDIAKMAVLMGIEYQIASEAVNKESGCSVTERCAPKNKSNIADALQALEANLKCDFDSKLSLAVVKKRKEVAKAKIDTLLWFLSESEFIEDAKI